jgi:ABC-2 type transport system permease protein
VRKEWAELIRRRVLVLLMTLLPALAMLVATAAVLVLPSLIGEKTYNDPDLHRAFSALREHGPGLADLEIKALFQVLMLRQLLLLLLLVPIFVSMSVAAYSIVGEKVNRSLEPLLATPITTAELLLAKSLAAVIPGVALTWLIFGWVAILVAAFAVPGVCAHVFNATAFCVIFLIGPLVGLLGLSLVVIMSARTSDPRSAQQIGAVVVLPLVAIIVGQIAGFFFLTPRLALLGAAVLTVIDACVLAAGVAAFQRETILTRWK